MRRFFAKIHLWLSIPLGLIITVICFSGASLVFEQDITQALNKDIYKVEAKGKALPPSVIADRIEQHKKNGIIPDSLVLASLQYSGIADDVCMAGFKNAGKKSLCINPYTGDVTGWTVSYPFFQTMRKLHRWLLDPPVKKTATSAGKMIVGISTLVMVVITISGLVIWFPKNRKALGNRLKVSCNKGWRRFWYDSHVSLGFYATLLLLVMALTGLTWSFKWYRNAVYSMLGAKTVQTEKPVQAEKSVQAEKANNGEKKGDTEKKDGKGVKKTNFMAWDKAYENVTAKYDTYKNINIKNGEISINTAMSGMRKTDIAEFDRKSGNIVSVDYYKDRPFSSNIKGFLYSLHVGSWGGTVTQILYFLAAIIGAVLPLSGYYLWIKKKLSRKNRSR